MSSIAVITPVFPPYRGGIGRIAEMDALQLAALGHDVTVYVPHAAGPSRIAAELPYRVEEVAPLFRYGNAAFVPQIGDVVNDHQLTILHYPFFGGAEAVAFASRGRGAGRLFIAYHMDVKGTGGRASFFKTHEVLVAPSVLRSADGIIVTSKDYAAHSSLLKKIVGQVPFHELAPSIDIEAFAPGDKNAGLMARYGIAADDIVATFVGGLDNAHYFKGVPVLLEALASLDDEPRIKALIVGDGNLRPTYEKLARERGIEGRVIFAGSVSDAELAAHFRLGDFFVFPSIDRSEAFGIAALESLACGVPVIASVLPGVRTIVRPGETGMLVRPGDADALADAMARMAGDHRLRARLAEGARALALRYSHDARMNGFDAIIKNL